MLDCNFCFLISKETKNYSKGTSKTGASTNARNIGDSGTLPLNYQRLYLSDMMLLTIDLI